MGVFLFLSGYGMSLSLQRHAVTPSYVRGKALRLFEPYVIYWLVELAVLLCLDRQAIGGGVLHDMGTLGIFPHTENWFFKVILGLYLCIILLALTRLSATWRTAVMTALCLAYMGLMRHWGFGSWWYANILLFPMGMLVAHRYDWFARIHPYLSVTLLLCLLIAGHTARVSPLLLHMGAALLLVWTIRIVPVRHGLLHYVGVNSFVFYFLECPAMDHLAMPAYRHFPTYCLLSVVLTFLLSAAAVWAAARVKKCLTAPRKS